MPDDPVERVLRLVAEGRLTADEAAPILEALDRPGPPPGTTSAATDATAAPERNSSGPRGPRYARIEVTERGRKAVDLRIPLSLGRRALGAIPGLSAAQAAELDEAVNQGSTGPVLTIVDDDGDGVRIGLE